MSDMGGQFGPSTRVLVVLVVVSATVTLGLPVAFSDRWPMPAAVIVAYLTGGASAAVGIFMWFRAVLHGVGAALRKSLPAGTPSLAAEPPAVAEPRVPLVRRAEAFFDLYPNVTNVVTSGLLPFIGGILAAIIGAAAVLTVALLT